MRTIFFATLIAALIGACAKKEDKDDNSPLPQPTPEPEFPLGVSCISDNSWLSLTSERFQLNKHYGSNIDYQLESNPLSCALKSNDTSPGAIDYTCDNAGESLHVYGTPPDLTVEDGEIKHEVTGCSVTSAPDPDPMTEATDDDLGAIILDCDYDSGPNRGVDDGILKVGASGFRFSTRVGLLPMANQRWETWYVHGVECKVTPETDKNSISCVDGQAEVRLEAGEKYDQEVFISWRILDATGNEIAKNRRTSYMTRRCPSRS